MKWICPICNNVWDDYEYTKGKNPKGCDWFTSMKFPICKRCSHLPSAKAKIKAYNSIIKKLKEWYPSKCKVQQ